MCGAAIGDEADLRDVRDWRGSVDACLVEELRRLSDEKLKCAPPLSEDENGDIAGGNPDPLG